MKLAKYCSEKLNTATEKVNKILTENKELVDFEINDKDTDFCSEYGILKKNVKGEDILLTDDLEFYIIELPKLRKKLENAEEIDNKKLVAWLKYINNPNEVEEKDMEDNEYLEEAYRVLEDISSSEEEKILAEYRIDAWRNEQSVKKHWQKETKKEIAKKLLDKGVDISIIIEASGLTKEEIEELK